MKSLRMYGRPDFSAITRHISFGSVRSSPLIVNVIGDDTLAQMTVEIYNQLGALVASGVSVGGVTAATLPTPAAGTYKVRVKNYGLLSVNQTPTFIVREPGLP